MAGSTVGQIGVEFAEMVGAEEGFGGIVFGNEVTASGTLPRILSLSYQTGPGGDGQLQATSADGRVFHLDRVNPEDAYAAYQMVYTGVGSVRPMVLGNGVGLVGLTDRQVEVKCDASRLQIDQGALFNIVLHPALGSRDLGWAAIMVDALPIEVPVLTADVKSAGADVDAQDAIQNLFLSMQTKTFVYNWKVVDVAMSVSAEGDLLVVQRTDGDFAEGLRRSSFIEMRPMLEGGDYDRAFAKEFYRLLPVLTNYSVDYRRINGFARVLALVRLAKTEHATFTMSPPAVEVTRTPDAVLVTDSSISPAAPSTLNASVATASNALDRCFSDTAKLYPTVIDTLSKLIALERKRDAEVEAAHRAREGSDEERRAVAAAGEYDRQMDALLHNVEQDTPAWVFTVQLLDVTDEVDEYADYLQRTATHRTTPPRGQQSRTRTVQR